ncbi:MAG: glycoside hydrolase family 5 protein [Chloroflexota bacterium]|nr:MAG: glycoside hydrolase family 5 protein [Chloroflexota bacterium]
MTGLLGGLHPQVASAMTPPEPTPNFLHAEGSRLVDSDGKEVVLTGVNWFGMETGTFAPHGLWARSLDSMLDQIVALGFNTIRLPYSNEMFHPTSKPQGIDFAINPDLKGLTGIQIMDKVVEGAQRRGLKIFLDQHRPNQYGQSNLWYTDKLSEQRWISDWVMLAQRYKGNDTVIGADLHNEPHGEATWGTGNVSTDWRLAAERAGNAILAANPDWLIIVEGVDSYKGIGYWWGGNLRGVKDHPVRLSDPSKLVYSAHDYGPGVSGQSWFSAPDFPSNLSRLWEENWAYLVHDNVAPVILGEFGGHSVSTKDVEGIWQRTLVAYLRDNRISYTYWSFNPNSADTGGVLEDDWTTVNEAKHQLLATYQASLLGRPVKPAETAKSVKSGGASLPWSREYLEQVEEAIRPQSRKQPVVPVWEDPSPAAAGLKSEQQALGRH